MITSLSKSNLYKITLIENESFKKDKSRRWLGIVNQ